MQVKNTKRKNTKENKSDNTTLKCKSKQFKSENTNLENISHTMKFGEYIPEKSIREYISGKCKSN